jgi:hypothetical protein
VREGIFRGDVAFLKKIKDFFPKSNIAPTDFFQGDFLAKGKEPVNRPTSLKKPKLYLLENSGWLISKRIFVLFLHFFCV